MAENDNIDKVADESKASEPTVATTHSIVTKQRRKRSRAWDFFEEKVDAKGNRKYECRFCGKEYFETKGKSTTQMNGHIDKCPKNPYKVEKGQKLLQFQTLPGVNKGGLIPWKFEQEECRMALEKYLAEDPENERPDFDILAWWKVNSPRFPILAKMVRDVLAIPISSVASESAFSTGGRILDQFRSSLTPKLVETLVCLQDWLRSESLPVNVEEDLDYLETLEEDFTNLGKEASTDDVC